MKEAFSLQIVAFTIYLSLGQSTISPTSDIQDIRLGNPTAYGNQGRVEVLYNNTWGTICDNYWTEMDGEVACRMLGYSEVFCTTSNAQFDRVDNEVPIWMSDLSCRGTEEYLDDCEFYGWGPEEHDCTSHSSDAGVVCRNESALGIPEVSVENTTSRTIVISWPANLKIPTGAWINRFIVQYNKTTSTRSQQQYVYVSRYGMFSRYYASITNLNRNTELSISVRLDVSFTLCPNFYLMSGTFSDPINVRTNITARESIFDVRLISPISSLNFLGRVEVLYNNTWGTVCDNSFDDYSANVICHMLNYSQAVCYSAGSQMGEGSGKIWLNGVQCIGAEILDDCSYSFHGSVSTFCSTIHLDDVGVVCMPDPQEFLPAPEGFNIINHQVTSVTFSWKRYIFPSNIPSKLLFLEYTRSDTDYFSSATISYYQTTYTIERLPIGITINATIRPKGRFTNYACYHYIDGARSESQSITIMERSPSGPPQSFHISVVNCSAIRAEWDLPSYDNRNGIVRGYKLIILYPNGSEIVISCTDNITQYIIGGLEASMRYVVSVLAYTVGDGPRSIHLTATTNPQNMCQTDIINIFGNHGDTFDKIILYTSYTGTEINILCGSSLPGVEINWFFSNGTQIGIRNRDIHEGHFVNGTTALQFGLVTPCDAGLYTCRANQTSTGRGQQKTFKVKVNYNPPIPGRPIRLGVTSTTATISWTVGKCDGGHGLQFFTIRIGSEYHFDYYYSSYYNYISYRYIRGLDAHQMNYTIIGLTANSNYDVSLRAEGQDSSYSHYSNTLTITTLPPAPSPPRNVYVVLIAPDTILVTWTRPSVSNGIIAYYTVSATPFNSMTIHYPRAKRQAESLLTVAKNFSFSASSGNLTLPQQGVEYHVQVSVTVLDSFSGTNRESIYSALNPNAILFVPIQGLPYPRRVSVSSSSNVSLTLTWDTPTTTGFTINGYLVEYSAMVEGRSRLGNLISFIHEGNFTTTGNVNHIKMLPLIPQTNYLLKVAALTNRGEGMQVRLTGLTNNATSDFERFVYFHIRFGPVLSCSGFRKDIEGQESSVKKQILESLNDMCHCRLTDVNIETGFFSCGQQDHQIIYRAHILGTRNYSAIDLVDLLQSWVRSSKAYIRINSFRLQLDPTCPSQLDTLDDPECPVIKVTTPKPMETDKPIENPTPAAVPHSKNAAEIGGLFVSVIIAVLFIVIIVFGIFYCCRKIKPSSSQRKCSDDNKFRSEDHTPFADIAQSTESSLYEEKLY